MDPEGRARPWGAVAALQLLAGGGGGTVYLLGVISDAIDSGNQGNFYCKQIVNIGAGGTLLPHPRQSLSLFLSLSLPLVRRGGNLFVLLSASSFS